MGPAKTHCRLKDDMQLDELGEPGRARAQIVHVADARVRAHERENSLAIFVRQLAIHKHVDRLAADAHRAPDHVGRDRERHADVDQRLLEVAGEKDARAHGDVGHEVGHVVRLVRMNGQRLRATHDMALEEHQGERQDHAHAAHDHADMLAFDGPRIQEAVDDGHADADRRSGDEAGLRHAGQRLGLAVAEAMLGVGRRERLANGEESDERRHEVERGVDQGRQHAHRAGEQPRRRLGRDQGHGYRHGGKTGQPHQAAGFGRAGVYGYSVRVDHGAPADARLYSRRSCRRKAPSCQNSIRMGCRRKPDQCGGLGTVPTRCFAPNSATLFSRANRLSSGRDWSDAQAPIWLPRARVAK